MRSVLPNTDFISLQLGVWLIILKRSRFKPWTIKDSLEEWKAKVTDASLLRLFQDIHSLGPNLFIVAVISNCLYGLEDAMVMWSYNQLLMAIEAGYKGQQDDCRQMVKALYIRIFFITMISVWRWAATRACAVLATRVKLHFEERLLHAHLSVDLAASQRKSGAIGVYPDSAWNAFEAFLRTIRALFTTLSQLLLITTLMSSVKNSPSLILLAASWPIFSTISGHSLWNQTFIAYAVSVPYKRLKAMYNLATFRKEVISGGLSGYILKEYRKAREMLGDTSLQQPWELYSRSSNPFADIGVALFRDFPLIYYAAECVYNHSTLSLASLATLQQTCSTLQCTIVQVIQEKNIILDSLKNVRELYCDYGALEDMQSGPVPYSPAPNVGMGIEFRDVTFRYPNADTGKNALRNITFTLTPSSLVVIVGANGSGKSSIVNLLAGLYSPTSGNILIDGRPAEDYQKADLQSAVALLTQECPMFGLSLGESIGIGDPDAAEDGRRIEQAARLGGAYGFVQRFNQKFDEVLQPISTSYASDHPMKDEYLRNHLDIVERQTDISGGERQRLAASRTFMRIMSPKVKLVIVDEPTSAMDPLGEYEIFERLRYARPGKTMVFVTHRFGHLTKYADLILCMQNGQLVESGTHQELLAKNGEYHRLYSIQASAFNGSDGS